MIRIKSKISLVLALFLLLQFAFAPPVSADGMMHINDRDMWLLQNEERQLCAINYENGVENLILSVEVSGLQGEKAVWIFPVPAKPDKTAIDIIKGFPRLRGYDLEEETHRTIAGVFNVMRLSQIYSILLYMYLSQRAPMYGKGIEEGIAIHEHIEKMGLTTELVTAEEGAAFHNYLTAKGLDLPADSISLLEEYIGEEYSFVVSWISDIEEFKQESAEYVILDKIINTLGVSIAFPTDKVYFPLKPTSIYGSQEIPILIYVMGHMTPELYPEIKRESQVNYFVQSYYMVPEELSDFFNGKTKIEELKYTKIKINTPSKYLTEDLWIEDAVPAYVTLSEFVKRIAWIWGILFFILSSCLASMLAGIIAFRKDKPKKMRFALFGLWNLLTLIGFMVASIFLKTKKLTPELEQQLKSLALKVWDSRKILFIFLFTVFFLMITFALQLSLQAIF